MCHSFCMRPSVSLPSPQFLSCPLGADAPIIPITPPTHPKRSLLQREQSHFHSAHHEQTLPQLWCHSHLQQQQPLLQSFVLHSIMSAPEHINIIKSQVSRVLEWLLVVLHQIASNLRWPVPISKHITPHTKVQNLPNVKFAVLYTLLLL
ncbi:hypothetical protein KP509_24G069100 [Ceratopteris richardii]|uniref:Uncharacterized protein n=3 Tax=Ceratopteris richardii TaxID=49495 RepID=A0A8T2RYT1_CERRI|nr:hypothetical protein KP509_24G069100 [Ceratopteris richardii]